MMITNKDGWRKAISEYINSTYAPTITGLCNKLCIRREDFDKLVADDMTFYSAKSRIQEKFQNAIADGKIPVVYGIFILKNDFGFGCDD